VLPDSAVGHATEELPGALVGALAVAVKVVLGEHQPFVFRLLHLLPDVLDRALSESASLEARHAAELAAERAPFGGHDRGVFVTVLFAAPLPIGAHVSEEVQVWQSTVISRLEDSALGVVQQPRPHRLPLPPPAP